MTERSFFSWITRHPFVVIAATTLVTAALASQLPKLRIDPDTEAFVPQDHPVRSNWRETKKLFDVGKDIFVAIKSDGPDGIFTPEILRSVSDLTHALEQLDTVMAGDVRSIANSDAIVGTKEGLLVEPFFDDPPETLAEARAVRDKVFANEVFLDRLVSRDASIAVIIVQAHDAYEADSPYPHPVEVYREVAELARRTSIPSSEIFLAGTTATEAVFGRQMEADLARLIPLALMIVVAVLFLCFPTASPKRFALTTIALFVATSGAMLLRSGELSLLAAGGGAVVLAMLTVRGVFIPSLIVVLSVLWTLGAQAALGLPIYIVGTIIPPLLLAIGCADGIHILGRYFETARQGGNSSEIVIETMLPLWRPVLVTSLTTAAGFGSLIFTKLAVFQAFGASAAIGILAAMLLSVFLMPAILALLPAPEALQPAAAAGTSRLLEWLGRRTVASPRAIVAAGSVFITLALVAASQMRVDYSWVESLAPGTPELEADRLLRTRHGGSMPLDIVVTAAEDGGIKDPRLLRGLDRSLAEIAAHPAAGDTRSIAEYVKRMNQAMNEDRPEEMRIPDSRDLVAQYLLLYSMSGDPTEFDDMVDYDYRSAHAGVLLRSDWLTDMDEVIRQADASLERNVRSLGATATITGSAMITDVIFGLLIESQISSLATAAILVFLLLVVLYRSPTDALICMLPPLFTAVTNFAGMALLDVPLGPMKAMVGAVALGIGIDYSIHLISSLRLRLSEESDPADAIVATMRSTGRAILLNALVVVAGFSLLALSQTPSNASFGVQIAVNMALCCAAALLLLPAVVTLRLLRNGKAAKQQRLAA